MKKVLNNHLKAFLPLENPIGIGYSKSEINDIRQMYLIF